MNALRPNPQMLLDHLRLLCADASVAGTRDLADSAENVVSVLRANDLDCEIVPTSGAPIVVGRYNAQAQRTLLVYGRYDVPPAGTRRNWSSDPFQPAVRDDILYARGAIVKAELVARAAAIKAVIAQHVPLNIVVVVEGESLIGSPHLDQVRERIGPIDQMLWSGGSFDAADRPIVYTGVKGLLQVELNAVTATTTLPLTYAAAMPNPVWTLVQALGSIKSEFEEILIEGFYDDITPPGRDALRQLQGMDIGDQARRAAWGVRQFLANVGGAQLTRTETVSPACNISALTVTGGAVPSIPQRASAEVQFQLVPDQTPARLLERLEAHLAARGFADLAVQQRPGAYDPLVTEPSIDVAAAVTAAYGQPGPVLFIAPFAAPAAVFGRAPLLSCGLERPSSAVFGADEHVPLPDLQRHADLIHVLITQLAV